MNKNKLSEVLIIFACGAVGGVLGWLIGINASGHIEGNWLVGVLTALLGGGVAAGVGIYLIANSDTTQMARCIFLAALCGISWKLLLETGRDLVIGAAQEKKVVALKQDLDQRVEQAEKNSNQENVQAVKESTIKLAQKLPAIRDSELIQEARSSAEGAIAVITDKQPEAAPAALKEIVQTASMSGSIFIESAAEKSLNKLSTDPAVDQKTKQSATTALEELKAKP